MNILLTEIEDDAIEIIKDIAGTVEHEEALKIALHLDKQFSSTDLINKTCKEAESNDTNSPSIAEIIPNRIFAIKWDEFKVDINITNI